MLLELPLSHFSLIKHLDIKNERIELVLKKTLSIKPLRNKELAQGELEQILTFAEKKNPAALKLLNDLIESRWICIDCSRKKHFKALYIDSLKVATALNGIEGKIDIEEDWQGVNHFIAESFAERKHPLALHTLAFIIDFGFFTRDDRVAPYCKNNFAYALELYKEAANAMFLDSIKSLLYWYPRRKALRTLLPALELQYNQAIAFHSMINSIQSTVDAQRQALLCIAS